jgi:seryl-tRNA synthetase
VIDIKLLRDNPDEVRRSQLARGDDPGVVDADPGGRRAPPVVTLAEFESARAAAEGHRQAGRRGQGRRQGRPAGPGQGPRRAGQEPRRGCRKPPTPSSPGCSPRRSPMSSFPARPSGGEEDYVVREIVGTPRDFAAEGFEPRDHLTLGESLAAIDTERGAKVAGARFYFLTGVGARLELALLQMADRPGRRGRLHPDDHAHPRAPRGHEGRGLYRPPRRRGLLPAGRRPLPHRHVRGRPLGLPRRRDHRPRRRPQAVCRVVGLLPPRGRQPRQGHQGHHPGAPVPQGRDVRLLPARGRRGRARAAARDGSGQMLDKCELPYRIIDTAAGDLGDPAARKFDCEGWVPTQGRYRELTSTSNCTTFQARRLGVRERDPHGTGGHPHRRHPQRHPRDHPLDRRHPGKPPAGRRVGHRPGRAAALHGRASTCSRRCAEWIRGGTAYGMPGRRRLVGSTSTARSSATAGDLDPRVRGRDHGRVADAGHHVVIATGRSVVATMPILEHARDLPRVCRVLQRRGDAAAGPRRRKRGYKVIEKVTFDPGRRSACCATSCPMRWWPSRCSGAGFS